MKKQILNLPGLCGSVAVLRGYGTEILGFHFTEVFHIETLFSKNGLKPAEPVVEAESHEPPFLSAFCL